MNARNLVNLISKNNIKVISVDYLHVNNTIHFTKYQIVDTIFYFFNSNEALSLDITDCEKYDIHNNILDIKLNKIYQEKFIQLFDDDIGHFGQFSFAGFDLMIRRYHKLDAMEIMVNEKEYVLHVSQLILNSAGFMLYSEPTHLSVIVPMYTIKNVYSIDTYKIIIKTF
ncbi:hypothetical protein AN640_05915 [Candidatus Epulonipiscium fishelsonii]|uniref:Uncharacterized protein n=1 Tax=Candidatus Epulonipiscium fishelsonii TaxID=77094 RepID=A0ACC8XI03_9FIRM|nr:hypothetical protein AN640_05915 [Epulopiscium sp. SCG-D08WGA-EpuloA1]OON94819.1 MAG: hypothetical protein ATN32_07855 [Epulopiscium sp. AS2M-Bin002]